MKFVEIDGKQCLIMEENDDIYLRVSDSSYGKEIHIKKNGEMFDIFGNSAVVNSIQGKGMLEKFYIPPVVSSQEIVKKCDLWLDSFRGVCDIFHELVSSDKYRGQHIYMNLSYSEIFSMNNDSRFFRINLDMIQNGSIIHQGVSISIEQEKEYVFGYLLVNIVSYLLEHCYDKINSSEYDGNLYYKSSKSSSVAVYLRSLMNNSYYNSLLYRLIALHNNEISFDQILAVVKSHVFDQVLPSNLDRDILEAQENLEYFSNTYSKNSFGKKKSLQK